MKKILAFILSVTLLHTCFMVPSFAAEETLAVNDEQMGLLYALGISTAKSTDDIKNFDEFTRSESAKYFCRLLKVVTEKPSSYEALYPDVTSEHKNYQYIKAMKNEGLMIGYTNGKFGPDDSIAVMDAATIVAKILGYGSYIKVQGINYIINKTGLLDGIEVSDAIKSDQMYRLLYNALHAPAVQMTGVDADGAILTLDDQFLGLDLLFNVIYKRGVVEGVENTELEKAASMHSDQVVINDTTFRYDQDAAKMLGYNVDYYYKEVSSGVYQIIYMCKNTRNKVLVIDSKDIQDYNAFQFKYYNKSGTIKTASITGNTDVILNGVAYPAFSKADMMPQMGQVTLIDNNSDNQFDVAVVDSYEFCIVGNIDAKNKIVYDKITNEKFDFSTADSLDITFDGLEYPIERIIQGNLLHIKRSKQASGRYIAEIDVRKDERTFVTVERVWKDAVLAGGIKYEVWDKIDPASENELTLNNAVTLYFYNGVVVRAVASEISGLSYGYLLDVHSEGDFAEKIQIMIVDQGGNATIYDVGKSVVIDGKSCKTANAVRIALSKGAQRSVAYDAVKYPFAQPVAFSLNKQGNLAKLDTAYLESGEEPEKSFSLDVSGSYTYSGYANGIYDSTWQNLATYGNAPVFGVPLADRDNFEKYRAYAMEANESGTKVDVFNIDAESKVAKVVFLYKDFTTESYNYTDPIYLVKEIYEEVGDDGEIGYSLTCIHIQKNVEESVRMSAEIAGDLGIGDMFRMSKTISGKIYSKEILFDKSKPVTASNKVIPYRGTSMYDGPMSYGYKFVYGTPILIKDGYMRMTKSLVTEDDFAVTNNPDNVPLGSAVIYQYSLVWGVPTVEPATQNDIKTYALTQTETSEVLLFVYSNDVRFMLVINE